MFTNSQKRYIADEIEDLLRTLQHPQLPTEDAISFHLHINGTSPWSFCDINNSVKHDTPNPNSPFTSVRDKNEPKPFKEITKLDSPYEDHYDELDMTANSKQQEGE